MADKFANWLQYHMNHDTWQFKMLAYVMSIPVFLITVLIFLFIALFMVVLAFIMVPLGIANILSFGAVKRWADNKIQPHVKVTIKRPS